METIKNLGVDDSKASYLGALFYGLNEIGPNIIT
jgi:hypothetical protein